MSFKELTNSYRAYINYSGSDIKNEYINSYIDAVQDSFNGNVAYEQITKNNNNNQYYDCHIIDEEAFRKEIPEKKILMKPSQTIIRGDIINRKNNTEHWIVLSIDDQYSFANTGKIKLCNHTMKWQNDEGAEIEEYCVLENWIQYDVGVKEDKYMRLGQGTYRITFQDNANTQVLKRDKRFIWDNIAYRITNINRTTKEGLCEVTVLEHQYNTEFDDIVNEVADSIGQPTYTINVLTDTLSLAVSSTPTLDVEVKLDGIIVNNPVLTYESNNTAIATVNSSGVVTAVAVGSCIITVYLTNNVDISDTANVTVTTSPISNVVEQIVGDDSISKGLNSNYEIYKYTNGVVLVDTYSFSIVGSGATVTTIDGNNCTVTASLSSGTFILRAINNITAAVINKTITLDTLW